MVEIKKKLIKKAFVVGIDNYHNMPNLDECAKDVKLLTKLLQSGDVYNNDFVVTTICDENEIVTQEKFLTSLGKFCSEDNKDVDIVLFYFSGHGCEKGIFASDAPKQNEGKPSSGFIPFETIIRDICYGFTRYKVDDIVDFNKPETHKIFVFDSCFSVI